MSNSRLTYTFPENYGTVSVEWVRMDLTERRHEYRWQVTTAVRNIRPDETFSGDDLRSGSGDGVNLPAMLGTLLSFLAAFGEARRHGSPRSDNWDLFPDGLAYWADLMQDELAMAREEIGAS